MEEEGEKILDRWNSVCEMPMWEEKGTFKEKNPEWLQPRMQRGVCYVAKLGT